MYIKRIGTKTIFGRYADLDWGNCCKIEIALVADKDNLNEEEDIKVKARQLINKK